MRLIIGNVELQDDINGVLQELGPCGSLGFGDLTDEDQNEVSLLGETTQYVAALSNLRGASRQCVRCVRIHGLDGIDNQEPQCCLVNMGENRVDVRLEKDKHVVRTDPEPICPNLQLLDGFLACDIE